MSASSNFGSTNWGNTLKLAATLTPVALGFAPAAAQAQNGNEHSFTDLYAQSVNMGSLTKINSPSDFVSKFNPGSNLYVQGNVGVSRNDLHRLNTWLNTTHANWFAVVVEQSEGAAWRSRTGQAFRNDKAYEFAIAYGLKEKGYEAPVHPGTKEPYEAFIIITMDENSEFRTVKFNGGPAFDKHGLDGQYTWTGNLDRLAIDRLRDGRDVVGAVRATVTGIESRLEDTLEREKAEEVRLRKEAENLLASNEKQKQELELAIERFKTSHPQASKGSLTQIDYATLNANLESAADSFKSGRIEDSRNTSSRVRTEIRGHLEELNQYDSAGTKLSQLKLKIDTLKGHPYAMSDAAGVTKSEKLFQTANDQWSEGQRGYNGHLNSLTRTVEKTKDAIEGAQKIAELKENTVKGGAIFLFLGTLLLGVIGFGRAKAAREKFNQKLSVVEAALADKDSQLIKLDSDTALLLDNTEFKGKSKEQEDAIGKEVPQLFITITSARDVVNRAKKCASAGLRGVFDSKPCRDAIAILEDMPVEFSHDSDLGPALKKQEYKSRAIWASLDSFKPFKTSMLEILGAFDEISKRATERLQRLETAQREGQEAFDGIAALLKSGSEGLKKVASTDGLQLKGSEKRIDALEEQQAALHQLIREDPISGAERAKADQSALTAGLTGLGQALEGFGEIDARLDAIAQTSTTLGVPVAWLAAERNEIDTALDAVITGLLNGRGNAEQGVAQISENGKTFLDGISDTLTVIKDTEQDLTSRLRTIAEARTRIAKKLNVSEEAIFTEKNHNPIEEIGNAQNLVNAMKAAVSGRDLEAAQAKEQEYRTTLQKVDSIVADSLVVLELFETKRIESESLSSLIEGQKEQVRTILEAMTSKYSGRSLLLDASEYADKQSNPRLDDNIKEIETALDEAERARKDSLDLFRAGNLLQARYEVSRSDLLNEIAQGRISEVRRREDRLKSLTIDIADRFEKCTEADSEFQTNRADGRTTRETGRSVLEFTRAKDALQAKREEAKPDLIEIEGLLKDLESSQRSVATAITNDWEAHSEATRSWNLANAALEKYGELSTTALTDAAGDSSELTAEMQKVRQYSSDLDQLRSQLQVAHSDWRALDTEIDALTLRINNSAKVMAAELEDANKALKAIGTGKTWITKASSWSGSYGITITYGDASRNLKAAYALLEAGNYDEAIKKADLAERQARGAISQGDSAVNEESQRREAARRQAAAEEAARQAAAYASSTSSSSSSSSDSGFGSSSYSSGSGFGSSNW